MSLIESSSQEIPLTPEQAAPLASSVPLHDLAELAPAVMTELDMMSVTHPISNDESAAYYHQLQSRTLQEDYRNATNRTAIIIGEGTLISALPYISEDTIILLDNSEEMVSFMTKYVEALREAGTIEEWGELMGLKGIPTDAPEAKITGWLFRQSDDWQEQGYASSVFDEESYALAARAAREKAIIPWHGDITSRRDMKTLGKALGERDAHVTFMNLSNVMSDGKAFDTTAGFAKRLKHLPFTSQAPIMTTSTMRKGGTSIFQQSWSREATGPFFGLDNLSEHGGNVSVAVENPGAVALRRYFGVPEGMIDGVPASFVANLLAGVGQDNGRRGEVTIPLLDVGSEGTIVMSIGEIPPEFRDALKGIID